ncbi:MAG: phosphoribosylformylglycinamidine synthase I [Dehalococcoidia bacterium]|nr:phosphoribosylformylglycinamidine synthase I [Dehalococcoidia bacterium]MQG16137.1 phosphoribosylformylglycinamidine synthase subunit PurQ [SAR202 cluster bacterium]
MKTGIVIFPGTWSDKDCMHVFRDVLKQSTEYIWHQETDLSQYDCIVIPGGFSYGDYLRAGAIARFAPVMKSITDFAAHGGLVIGICNGFQVLCEAGLLPGALMRNDHLQFRCQWVNLKIESDCTPFTKTIDRSSTLRVPISHGEGQYYASSDTLKELERDDRIVFRYCEPNGDVTKESNPNGSVNNIAGIVNISRNVLGMMPHPEKACEDILGSSDGLGIFQSILNSTSK